MRIAGIICEYNPFHSGHLYHITETKKAFPEYKILCLMSGNFTQRGEAAIFDKFTRAKSALLCGADIVIELPAVCAVASANYFARGAVRILGKLECDVLSFGSETDDLDFLASAANILNSETDEFKQLINTNLNLGFSYPRSRFNALAKYMGSEEINSPNAILAIEYLRELNTLNSNTKPFLVKRASDYNSKILTKNNYPSATALRKRILEDGILGLNDYIPEAAYAVYSEAINNGFIPACNDRLSRAIIYSLLSSDLQDLPDSGEGLYNRLKKSAYEFSSLEEIISAAKSKRYTRTRLNRLLIYSLLRFTKEMQNRYFDTELNYIRVLGVSQNSHGMLNYLGKKIKIVTTPNIDDEFLSLDVFAGRVYSLAQKNSPHIHGEFSKFMIV